MTDRLGLNELEADSVCTQNEDYNLNLANQLVKDSENWLAVHELDSCKRYITNHLEIRLVCHSTLLDLADFHLIFRAVPGGNKDGAAPMDRDGAIYVESGADRGERAHNCVFVGFSQLVQCPEEVVPSFVWFERAEVSNDFLRGVFVPSIYGASFKLAAVDGKGKVCLLAHDSEHGLVESGTKVIGNIDGFFIEDIRERLDQLEFNNFASGVSIRLYNKGIGITLVEGVNLPFEISGALLRPLNV